VASAFRRKFVGFHDARFVATENKSYPAGV
jgi:hypothetical protein